MKEIIRTFNTCWLMRILALILMVILSIVGIMLWLIIKPDYQSWQFSRSLIVSLPNQAIFLQENYSVKASQEEIFQRYGIKVKSSRDDRDTDIFNEGLFLENRIWLESTKILLSHLPQGIVSSVRRNSLSEITIVEEVFSPDYNRLNYQDALYFPAQKRILINGLKEPPKSDRAMRLLAHEFGHAYHFRDIERGPDDSYATIYFKVMNLPETREFSNIANWLPYYKNGSVVIYRQRQKKEAPNLNADFDIIEDFATTFAYYFLYPNKLKKDSPEKHAWMQKDTSLR